MSASPPSSAEATASPSGAAGPGLTTLPSPLPPSPAPRSVICMEQVRALPVPLAFRMDKRAKAMVKSAAVVSCCEQTFHMTCLCQWLEKGKEDHSSCPCCRAPIHHLLLANPPRAPAQALPSPEEALADAMSSPSEASFRIADAGELPSQEEETADLHGPVDGEVEVDVEDPRPARRVVPNPLGRLGDPLTVGECGTSGRPRDAARRGGAD